MTSKIFVLTGRDEKTGHTINSDVVIHALARVKTYENDAPYDYEIVPTNNTDLISVLNDPETVAGIIPGCDSSQLIRNQIGRTGLDALHDFVKHDGGALAGFCAGGYLMGKHIIYGDFLPEKHRRQSSDNIRLIDATYYGPLSRYMLEYAFRHPENPYISTANINTRHEQNMPIVYWHGGVAMLPENQKQLRALATFSDPIVIDTKTVAPIAVGIKDFKSGGKAIASTIHPEVFGDYLATYATMMADKPTMKGGNRMIPHYYALREPYAETAKTLKQHQDGVYSLFKDVVDELLDCGKARKQANKTLETAAPTR